MQTTQVKHVVSHIRSAGHLTKPLHGTESSSLMLAIGIVTNPYGALSVSGGVHPKYEPLTLLSPQFPEGLNWKAAGRDAAKGRGGPADPLGEFGLF